MTNNIRVFLWLGLALALWLNYSSWQADYGPKPAAPVAAGSTTIGDGSGTAAPGLSDSVPQAAQSTATPTPANAPTPATALPVPEAQAAGDKTIRVVTDVLVVDISLKGGTLVRAELPGYPITKGQAAPVVLLNRDSAATNYVLQTGLTGPSGGRYPHHQAEFTSPGESYNLAPGQNELPVPLTWTDGNGVTVTKTFRFRRSEFAIGLEYQVTNASSADWQAAAYSQISRVDPPVERSMFKVDSFATRGPAIWGSEKTGEKNIYKKWKIDQAVSHPFSADVRDGWLAGIQHHFVTAVVPDRSQTFSYTLKANGQEYLLTAAGPLQDFKPGTSTTIKEELFVGPKLQKQLVTLHPELDRVADYTWLTLIAKPLFWLLNQAHSIVRNWGLAIILVTFLLKLCFYPLAQYAGKSMARMRTLTPRIKQLQETYKDDREKLGRSMMELYRTEKVNPLSGCLPMLIQMPVFLAFYWVLLESVEMRQAPFFGWINDLSARDPFFILPLLNGLAMWGQYKLNPPPPDPMQAKVFQFMPVVFSVMFALFPAGLVLYWVTNTGLSILQQWNINRHIADDDRKRKS
jgi:YidC/Oxa1 family membrane protein insertase